MNEQEYLKNKGIQDNPRIIDVNGQETDFYLQDLLKDYKQQLTIPVVSDTLILTPNDAELFFNEIMNPKEANEALKKAMLKFITR